MQGDFGEIEAVKNEKHVVYCSLQPKIGSGFCLFYTQGKHPCPSKVFHSSLLMELGFPSSTVRPG